ncbi:universal stress protein [Litchfieldella qijiaojingensis]|uniref:Universal stress protein n=1 Tax=Litchfieldella qijiaojingensis TaxID=980347 RepID=A0ABQ2YYV4_9GAMM|nr:universal stress protein [Halomonas qijiaojingensis]GGX98391.1 universal stress protein [Halomonas qijiaojingensis]
MTKRTSLVAVPVDGSPSAIAAARHASHLVTWLEVPLQLLYVKPLNPAELSDIPANRLHEVDHDHGVLQRAADEAFAKAREVLAPSFNETIQEITLHEESFVKDPSRVIVDYASQHPGCMIVMGSRGVGELGRFMLGSVSNAVVHKYRGAVTIVHDNDMTYRGAHLEWILLPVDGSPHSDAAAELAAELSLATQAPVDLMFCHAANPASSLAKSQLDNERQESRYVFSRARKHLGKLNAAIVEHHIVTGHPAEGIITHVRQQTGSVVLIMGHRGMSQWQDHLLGSVSHRVIDAVPCPVTVVT